MNIICMGTQKYSSFRKHPVGPQRMHCTNHVTFRMLTQLAIKVRMDNKDAFVVVIEMQMGRT